GDRRLISAMTATPSPAVRAARKSRGADCRAASAARVASGRSSCAAAALCTPTISSRTLMEPSYCPATIIIVDEFTHERGQLDGPLLGDEVAAERQQLEPSLRAGDGL